MAFCFANTCNVRGQCFVVQERCWARACKPVWWLQILLHNSIFACKLPYSGKFSKVHTFGVKPKYCFKTYIMEGNFYFHWSLNCKFTKYQIYVQCMCTDCPVAGSSSYIQTLESESAWIVITNCIHTYMYLLWRYLIKCHSIPIYITHYFHFT